MVTIGNESYTLDEIMKEGLKEKEMKELTAKIFEKEDMVYFFDVTTDLKYRLFSVIHKRSFFL